MPLHTAKQEAIEAIQRLPDIADSALTAMKPDFPIIASGSVTHAVLRLGIDHFQALAEHVLQLPYGRPATQDILSVLEEQRGTCSSKHRLLAAVAHESERPEIELIVGIYAMSENNTPGVGSVLTAAGVASIPEAHCYLRHQGQRHDFTGLESDLSSPFEALLAEHVVTPANLPTEKARLHRDELQSWAAHHKLAFDEAWALREKCIEVLVADNAQRSLI